MEWAFSIFQKMVKICSQPRLTDPRTRIGSIMKVRVYPPTATNNFYQMLRLRQPNDNHLIAPLSI
jgi:hypothetical protein